MPNITLKVDETIIRKVRKIAIDKNTSMTQMVRDFLAEVAARDDTAKKRSLSRLQKSFRQCAREMGPRKWQREDIYDRH